MQGDTTQAVIAIASQMTIDTPEKLQEATNVLHGLKDTLKRIEDEESKVVDPLKEALKAEQGRFKPFKDELKQAIDHIRQEQASYAQARADEQAKIAEAVANGTASIEQAMTAFTPDEVDGVAFRKGTRLKVIDASVIPKAYLLPNEELILEALKAGKKVKGCEIEEYQIPVNRKK